MTTFTSSTTVHKPADRVFESAITVLTNNGFVITQRDATSVSLTGPGLNSTRQNPILGVSRIVLRLRDSVFSAEAEPGGADAMQKFLIRFPMLLGVALSLLFGIGGGLLFGRQFGVGFGVPWAQGWNWMIVAIGGAMLPVLPWFILSPLLGRMIRKRTQKAIETLVQNAAFP